jgi:hypothetical protein
MDVEWRQLGGGNSIWWCAQKNIINPEWRKSDFVLIKNRDREGSHCPGVDNLLFFWKGIKLNDSDSDL